MPEPFQILDSAGPRDGVRVIRLIGPCTLAEMFQFQEVVLQGQPAPITLLDVTDVPYMDSAALGSVVRLHVSCEQKKTKYALVGVCDRLKTLFRVTHVDSALITYPTIDEALAAL
jgi:anti-sigma B factor antagonist